MIAIIVNNRFTAFFKGFSIMEPDVKIPVGYVRVSTVHQRDEGVSLDAQRGRIEGWVLGAGLQLNPSDVFVDAGISGKRADNRPSLQHALDRVCEVQGILVVYSLSRLARSVRDTLSIAERLQDSGADLVSLSEQINTTSAAGKMIFRLLAVLAEFERDLISERTIGAMRYKASKGESLGKVPFGKALGPDGRTLIDNPAETEALEMAERLAAQGWPLRRIASALDETGLKPRRGEKWEHSTVGYLLKKSRSGDAA